MHAACMQRAGVAAAAAAVNAAAEASALPLTPSDLFFFLNCFRTYKYFYLYSQSALLLEAAVQLGEARRPNEPGQRDPHRLRV